MLKLLWTLVVISLVAGDEINKVISNQTSSELIKNNNATSSTNSTTLKDKKVVHQESPIKDGTAAEGSEQNPIDPFKHATDDASIGNFKYYFVLLAFSSLSVIAIIVFKALR